MRVLFFSPHAGIWPHAFPEALVADAARSAGEVIYVTCGGALKSHCVTFAAHGKPPGTESVCDACRTNRDLLRGGFGLAGYDLDSVLDAEVELRIDKILNAADPAKIDTLTVDGIDVGRNALYEFLIERKKLGFALDDDEWRAFRPRLASTIRSRIAAERIIERERPDRIVVYNSLYSANAMWRAVAALRDIPFYFVHGGLSLHRRLQHLVVGRDTALDWSHRVIDAWPAYRDVPCTHAELAQVTEHFLHLFRGTSVFAYSAAKAGVDVRAKFGVRPDQKLLVAAMSSYDEYIAARVVGGVPDERTLLFPTQVEWTRALVRYLRARPDLFLLLRVHPREFPNKREGVKSEHARLLETELADLPPNVRVNWPADKLSIYDVAEHADVILNAWSSAGKEMALLGLPVVFYCPTALLYTAELGYVGTTEPAYFAAIEQALRDGWSFEHTRRAYRWHVLEYLRGVVDLGDAFDFVEDSPRDVLSRARNLILATQALRQRRDLWRRPPTFAARDRLAKLVASGAETLLEPALGADVEHETRALRNQVRRLVRALYGDAAGGPLQARLASVL